MPRKRNSKKHTNNSSLSPRKESKINDVSTSSDVSESKAPTNKNTSSRGSELNRSRTSASNSLYTKEGLKTYMEEKISEYEAKQEKAKQEVTALIETLRMSMTEEQLKTTISLEKLSDLEAIFTNLIFKEKEKAVTALKTPLSVKRQRRSRSAQREPLPCIQESPAVQGRSSSVGGRFQTPKVRAFDDGMVRYTVKKPFPDLDTGVKIKRFAKPGEILLSTAGSPISMQITFGPEAHIPLQNGKVLSIKGEAESARFEVPPLDEDTVNKVKILCSKLQTCIAKSGK